MLKTYAYHASELLPKYITNVRKNSKMHLHFGPGRRGGWTQSERPHVLVAVANHERSFIVVMNSTWRASRKK